MFPNVEAEGRGGTGGGAILLVRLWCLVLLWLPETALRTFASGIYCCVPFSSIVEVILFRYLRIELAMLLSQYQPFHRERGTHSHAH